MTGKSKCIICSFREPLPTKKTPCKGSTPHTSRACGRRALDVGRRALGVGGRASVCLTSTRIAVTSSQTVKKYQFPATELSWPEDYKEAKPECDKNSVHSDIHLGEQPATSLEDVERYQSEDYEEAGTNLEDHQSFSSLQKYEYERRSLHSNKYLYPINGNGSSVTAVKWDKSTQVVSPSGGTKRVRDEHEDDEGDRWGSRSSKRRCDDPGTGEEYETQYSSAQ